MNKRFGRLACTKRNNAPMPTKVLITGVRGLIGTVTWLHLMKQPDRYEVYGLDRRRKTSAKVMPDYRLDIPRKRFFRCDIAKMAAVQRAVEGMDVVIHLAADPAGRSWPSVLHNNVIGAYNVFEASRHAQVSRIIAASSVQVSAGHRDQEPYKAVADRRTEDVPTDFQPLTTDVPAEPRNAYACSKVWVESLARTYAHTHEMSCIALRIGWVNIEDRPDKPRKPAEGASVWCSQRDIVQLIERCVVAPAELKFDILYGISVHECCWLDIERARRQVGYVPQDRAEGHY